MHAIDAEKQMHGLIWGITDTSPLPEKEGRILVAVNVLADVIATGDDESNGYQISQEEAGKWLAKAIELLPDQVIHFAHFSKEETPNVMGASPLDYRAQCNQ